MAFELDWTFALAGNLPGDAGLPAAGVQRALERLAEEAPDVRAASEAPGDLDFVHLPEDRETLADLRAWLASAPTKPTLVVAGIGGSALSARVFAALQRTHDLVQELHVLDTVDPVPLAALLRDAYPASVRVLAVSKSGGTLETLAVTRTLEAWLDERMGAEATTDAIVAITGPGANPLRAHASSRGYRIFDVPEGVGGRYSALCAVGLLPALLMGLDVEALLAGAAAARDAGLSADSASNPAMQLAALHHAAWEAGRGTAVFWPYGERLGPLGPWWVQLVGESLGKRTAGDDGQAARGVGVTPLAARGPADQHSILQLLLEGPDDKFVTVLDPESEDEALFVPEDVPAGWPAAGLALGDVMRAEADATCFALAEAGRPHLRIRVERADEHALGALLMTYELAVVWWGRLLGVSPFGQPAVQRGKDATTVALAQLRASGKGAIGRSTIESSAVEGSTIEGSTVEGSTVEGSTVEGSANQAKDAGRETAAPAEASLAQAMAALRDKPRQRMGL